MTETDTLLTCLPARAIDRQPQTLDTMSRDASLFTVMPSAVAYPRSAADLTCLIQQAAAHDFSLTARGAGTDMTGGPLTQSVVLDFTRHFNQIKSVSDTLAVVQPGVYYRDLETVLETRGRLFPSYPASKSLCTVGGMVANNAGGEKSLAYGKTADYVASLKAIFSDGEEYTLEPLTAQQLQKKIAQPDFEGTIYQQMFELLETNYALIKAAKPRVSKNSAGYALWDVWDKQTFDLTRLFTGSQGTLGLMTEISFKLVAPKPATKLLVIFLSDLTDLAEIIRVTLKYEPQAFESYDDHTINLALRFLPDLIRRMRTKNVLKLLWQFLPEFKMIFQGGLPKLILLAEFAGHDEAEVEKRAAAAAAALRGLKLKSRLIRSASETEKYWTIRRESFNLLRHHTAHKRTAPFIDDITVLPQQLPQFLPRLNAIMDGYDITYTIAGHIGDANFHIIPLIDTARPDYLELIEKLGQQVYDLVFEFKGSMTGEHNDGLIRSHYLKQMYGEEIYALFEQVKTIFDPQNIFNPGKKTNADWNFAKQHLAK